MSATQVGIFNESHSGLLAQTLPVTFPSLPRAADVAGAAILRILLAEIAQKESGTAFGLF